MLLTLAGLIKIGFTFGPVDQMAFAFEDADDRQDAVVMRLPGQAPLDLLDGRLAHLPDDLHDLELFIGEHFRRLSRHLFAPPALKTNLYVPTGANIDV